MKKKPTDERLELHLKQLDAFFGDEGDLNEMAIRIIEVSPMSREDTIFLIKDYLKLTLKDFCLEHDLEYQMFYDALKGNREFTHGMQDEIRGAIVDYLIGARITIKI